MKGSHRHSHKEVKEVVWNVRRGAKRDLVWTHPRDFDSRGVHPHPHPSPPSPGQERLGFIPPTRALEQRSSQNPEP